MITTLQTLIDFFLAICFFLIARKMVKNKFGNVTRVVFIIFCFCAFFVSVSIANSYIPQERVTITALDEKSKDALSTHVYFKTIILDGKESDNLDAVDGNWFQQDDLYCWYSMDHKYWTPDQTPSITFQVIPSPRMELVFRCNKWKGLAKVTIGEYSETIDTFADSDDLIEKRVPVPFGNALLFKSLARPTLAFIIAFSILFYLSLLLIRVGQKIVDYFMRNRRPDGIIERYVKHKFLFEELVKRDFKKKYKRTVLGMAWSVLSPLLTLLVMRLVFTQFFGRNTAHYTIYLFCGNLVYSYFNESTSQGMLSLMGNSMIFTKVNVPKYMFLLSKNVQTLINFGLTLCAFFIFCLLDRIEFTWKFILLLVPIISLVLFNIGVGMILSALFVFFRDIQYLWSIFTLLLMYMSAIFYTIDRYSNTVQYLFFLNPVYLHIRYFRKIVIESTIPSLYFHLLMLFDVVVVLLIGRWMYKKYNTEFLYYV